MHISTSKTQKSCKDDFFPKTDERFDIQKYIDFFFFFSVLITFAAETVQDQPEDRGTRLTKKKVLKKINNALKKV